MEFYFSLNGDDYIFLISKMLLDFLLSRESIIYDGSKKEFVKLDLMFYVMIKMSEDTKISTKISSLVRLMFAL